ncbi:hypothetical protein [Celeribacter naphthalenivorans]|uniref:hypothetical protein n=1 Tax=Celeribacter naphthalenivorans TaxID=1614694 RepID=UPI001CFBE5A4|nr:hypothetical protein [Celeribacter naphthalenivorans]
MSEITPYILYLLLWAIVLLASVLPYILAPFFMGALVRFVPELEELRPKFRVMFLLLGLGIFAKLGAALIFAERLASVVSFLGTTLFAVACTLTLYIAFQSYKIGQRE